MESKTKIWDYKSRKVDKLAKQVAKDNDIVMTKTEMAKYLIGLVDFYDGTVVLDPCRGKGAFYDNLPNNIIKKYCEINEGIDYLQSNEIVDITLSNPPFVPRKLFWSFHQKAMETTRLNIYWLINLSSLNVFTPNRMKEMASKSWFFHTFHIVQDKRWFGRYVWIKFGREDKGIFGFYDENF